MITFKAHLNESLDSSYTINKKEWDLRSGKFEFLDDDYNHFIGYIIRTTDYDHENSKKIWTAEISFYQKTARGTTSKITNNVKNPLKVYSTIGRAAVRYFEEYPVALIEFTAAVDRTVDVYKKLAVRLARSLGGKSMFTRDAFMVIIPD